MEGATLCGCGLVAGIGSCVFITWVLGGGDRQIAKPIFQSPLALENIFIDALDGIIGPELEKTLENLERFSTCGMKGRTVL